MNVSPIIVLVVVGVGVVFVVIFLRDTEFALQLALTLSKLVAIVVFAAIVVWMLGLWDPPRVLVEFVFDVRNALWRFFRRMFSGLPG